MVDKTVVRFADKLGVLLVFLASPDYTLSQREALRRLSCAGIGNRTARPYLYRLERLGLVAMVNKDWGLHAWKLTASGVAVATMRHEVWRKRTNEEREGRLRPWIGRRPWIDFDIPDARRYSRPRFA
jgi:hypothetical protein